MYLFIMFPYYYFLKTRLKGKVQRISWLFVYFIPSFILFNHFASLSEFKNILLLLIGITIINYIYENGYLQNDVKTTQNEKNPTLRLSKEQMQTINDQWNKIVILRFSGALLLLFAFFVISKSINTTLSITGIVLLLQLLYLVYNNIRNIWNLVLLLPINYIRFYGFILPFVPVDKLLEFIVATVLLYPLSKVLEFTKRERFNLLSIGNKIGNVDKFRVFYYLIILFILFLLGFESIYIGVAIYYFAFRFLSYLAVSKSKGLQRKVRSNFSRQEKPVKETTQYNQYERFIAKLLIRFPKLKSNIKKLYQKLNYMRYKKDYAFKSDYTLTKIIYEDKESFFGYYDKSPINNTNEYIIFHTTNIDTKKMPDTNIPIDLVLYNIKNNKYKIIDKSYTYNWQQGTKLMWINEFEFIYNNYEKDRNNYISKIYNIKTKEFKIINFPIYDCFEDKFSISLNFDRLNIGRGDYSYSNRDVEIDWSNNSDDGLYYIDLQNNASTLIITLEDIIKQSHKDTMEHAKHKFNHIMISPDGSKMMFMHRWFLSDGRRYDSLYVSNIDGSERKIVADDDMVSHCFWYDNNNIFTYLRDKARGDKYYIVDIKSTEKTMIGQGTIDKFGDGHPNVYGEKILFDTYPNKSRMKNLFIYNNDTKELEKLGEFLESFDFYAETRCDLHPRFSFDGKKVFFDSVHSGKRQLYMIELN